MYSKKEVEILVLSEVDKALQYGQEELNNNQSVTERAEKKILYKNKVKERLNNIT